MENLKMHNTTNVLEDIKYHRVGINMRTLYYFMKSQSISVIR